jgi:predicted ArsR family transcriptional regulator
MKSHSDPDHSRALARLLRTVPPGGRRVASALLADPDGRTYAAVAEELGIHLGTVHQHLRRLRLRHPQVYAAVMAERRRQLARRHEQALARADAHNKDRYRKKPAHFLISLHRRMERRRR